MKVRPEIPRITMAVRVLSLLLPVGVLWTFERCSVFPWADSWYLTFGRDGMLSPLLHFDSNAFLLWPNPLGVVLPQGTFGYSLYLSALVLLFVGATSALIDRKESAAAIAVILLLCFGLNVVVLSSAAVFVGAAVLFGVERFALSRIGCVALGAMIALLGVSLTANAGFLLLLLAALASRGSSAKAVIEAGYSQQFLIRTTALSVAFVALQLLPSIVLPDYPSKSHVVPGYGVVEGLQPLFGSEPALLVIDRARLRAQFTSLTPLLLCVAFALFAFARFRRLPATRFATLGLALAAMTLLESGLVPITVSQVAPLQSFTRIVPEQIYLPLANLVGAMTVLCLLVTAAAFIAPQRAGWLLAASTLYAGVLLVTGARPLLSSGREAGSATETLLVELSEVGDAVERHRLQQLVLSPSLAVYSRFGLQEVVRRESLAKRAVPAPLPAAAELLSSHRSELLPLLRDGNPATRWSPTLGRQGGGEWMAIRFAEPQVVAGVVLGTGPFYTDFPRGLEVRAAESCPDPGAVAKSGALCVREDPWEGPLSFSSKGYPAFGSQYDVSVLFDAPRAVGCLVISQSGSAPSFDWSVSELSLLRDSGAESGR